MKNQFNKYYTTLFYLCSTFMLYAQPGDENDSGNIEDFDQPAAPIDDYLWILALAGLIFIFLKLRAAQSKKPQSITLTVMDDSK